jgi:ethanolamine utilization protein EutN
LARVIGTVVTTISAPFFDGRKLLICEFLTPDGRPEGGYVIAVDTVDAGPNQIVLVLDEGNSARQIVAAENAPVRAVIAGIVDAVDLAPAVSGDE